MTGYTKSISNFVNSCRMCNAKKDVPSKKGKMGRVSADRPFQVVSMDYLKSEHDTAGYHNILVVTDIFTKYAFAFPTRNETAITTAKVLVDKVFSVFGIPERLLSDNGKSFESEVIEQLCVLFGVKKVFTCPYSPKSDAICERYNRTLCNMLGTLEAEKRGKWSKYIQHMCNLYNSSVHSATGFSPFELMFGRKSRLPVDMLLATRTLETQYSSIRDYVKTLKARLEFVHDVARQAMHYSHSRNKERYDKTAPGITCNPGDKVVIKNVGVRGMHKLEPNWLPEEYRVVREIAGNPRVYEVKSLAHPRKKPRVLHIDMLKKVTDLDTMHQKCRVYHDAEVPNMGTRELFEREEGTDVVNQLIDPLLKNGQSNADKSRTPSKKAGYATRSRVAKSKIEPTDHPLSDSVSNSDTDSVSTEDETDEEPQLRIHFGTPKHAPEVSDVLEGAELGPEEIIADWHDGEEEEPFITVDDGEDNNVSRASLDIPDNDDTIISSDGETPEPEPIVERDVQVDDDHDTDLPLGNEVIDQSDDTDSTGSVEEAQPQSEKREYPKRDRKKTKWFGDLVSYFVGGPGPSPPIGPSTHTYL